MTGWLILIAAMMVAVLAGEWILRGGKAHGRLPLLLVVYGIVGLVAGGCLVRTGEAGGILFSVFWTGFFLSWFAVRSHLESSILLQQLTMIRQGNDRVPDVEREYHAAYGRDARVQELVRARFLETGTAGMRLTRNGRRALSFRNGMMQCWNRGIPGSAASTGHTAVGRNGLWMVLLLLLAGGMSLTFLHDRLPYFGDSVVYLEGARSLAAGEGYRSGTDWQTAWPPGYSAVLAVWFTVAGDSIAGVKGLNLLFALLACGLFYDGLRRCFPPVIAWWSVLAAAWYLPWIYYTQAVLSDMLFTVLVAWFVWGGCRYRERGRPGDLALAALAVMWAPLVRMAGVALIPAWMGLALFPGPEQRGGRVPAGSRTWLMRGALFTGMLVPLAGWIIRNLDLTGRWTSVATGVTPEYVASLAQVGITQYDWWVRLAVNLNGYLHVLVLPDQSGIARIGDLSWVIRAGCLVMAACLVTGWVAACRRPAGRFPTLALVPYAGMLAIHNWYDVRYVLPWFPVLMVLGAQGVSRWVAVLLPERLAQRVTVCLLFGWCLAWLVVNSISGPAGRLRSPVYSEPVQRLESACRAIRESGLPGDVLVCGGGGFISLWTGRRVVSLDAQIGPDGTLKAFNIPPGIAFVLSGEGEFVDYRRRFMEPFLDANRGRVEVFHREQETTVYRVLER